MEGVFTTNADWYVAEELAERQNQEEFTRKGFILQAIAASDHRNSAEELVELVEKVGRGEPWRVMAAAIK